MVVGEGMVAVVSALQDSGLTVSLLDAHNQYTLIPPKAVNKMYSMNNPHQQTTNQTQYHHYADNNHMFVPQNNQQNHVQHPVNNINLPAHNMPPHNLPPHNMMSHNLPVHNMPPHNLHAHNQYMPQINIPAVMAQMMPQIQQNIASTFVPTQTARGHSRGKSDIGCGETSGVGLKRNYGIQAVDGRYASTYRTSHCFVTPTSPAEERTEFPPQRPNIHYGSDHFYVDGWGQRKNHQYGGRGQPRPEKELPIIETRAQALFANSLRKYPSSPERSAEVIERLINYTNSRNKTYINRTTTSRPASPIRNTCEFDTFRPTNQRPIYRSRSPSRSPERRARWETSYKDELPSKDVKRNIEKPYFGTMNEVRFLRDMTRKVKENMRHLAHGNHMKGHHEPSTSHDKYEPPQRDIITACGTKRSTEAQATAPKCSQQTETMPRPPVEKKSVAISSVPEPKVSKSHTRLSDSQTHNSYKKSNTILNLTPSDKMANDTLTLKKSKSLSNIDDKNDKPPVFDKNNLNQDMIDSIYKNNDKCGLVLSPGSLKSHEMYPLDDCKDALLNVHAETYQEIIPIIGISDEKLDKKHNSLSNIKIDSDAKNHEVIDFDKNKLKQDLIDKFCKSYDTSSVAFSPERFESYGTDIFDDSNLSVHNETQEEISDNYVEKKDNVVLNFEIFPPHNNDYITLSGNDSKTDLRLKLKKVIEEWLKNLSLKLPDKLANEIELQEIVDYFYNQLVAIVENKNDVNFEKCLKRKIVDILEELPLDTFNKVTKRVYVRNMAVILVKNILKLLGTADSYTDQGSTSTSEDFIYFISENIDDEPIASHVKEILLDNNLELENNIKDTESSPSLSSVATNMVDAINNNVHEINPTLISNDEMGELIADNSKLLARDYSDDTNFQIREIDTAVTTNDNKVKTNMDTVDNVYQDFMDSQKYYMMNIVDHIRKWFEDNNSYFRNNEFDGIIKNIASDIVILKTYLEYNTTCFLTEREEINYLKIVVFKWLSNIVNCNFTKIIEEIQDLYDRIQNVDVPILIGPDDEKSFFVKELLVAPASNNNSYTSDNLSVNNNTSLGDEKPKSYLSSLEDAIMEWYHDLPLLVVDSQRVDQNIQLIKKQATEINVKVKANPSNINGIINKCIPSFCKKTLKGKNDKQREEDLKLKLQSIPFERDVNPKQVQARINNLKAIVATWAQQFPMDTRKDTPYSNNANREISNLAVHLHDILDKYENNQKLKEKKLAIEISSWLGGVPTANFINSKNFKEYFTRTLINEIKASKIEEFHDGDYLLGPTIRQWIWRLPAEDESTTKSLLQTSEAFIATLSELFQSKACYKRFADEILTYLKNFPLNTRCTDHNTIIQNEIKNLMIRICMLSSDLGLNTFFSTSTSLNLSKAESDAGCTSICAPFQTSAELTVMNIQHCTNASFLSTQSKSCENQCCTQTPNDPAQSTDSHFDRNVQTENIRIQRDTASGESQPAPKQVSRSTSLTDNLKLEYPKRDQTFTGEPPARGTQNTQTDYLSRNIQFEFNKMNPAELTVMNIQQCPNASRSSTQLKSCGNQCCTQTPNDPAQSTDSHFDKNSQTENIRTQRDTASGESQPAPKQVSRSTSLTDNLKLEYLKRDQTFTGEPPARGTQNIQTDDLSRNIQFHFNKKNPVELTVMNIQQCPNASRSSTQLKSCGNQCCTQTPNDSAQSTDSNFDKNPQTENIRTQRDTASGESQPAPKQVSRSTSLMDNRKLEYPKRDQTFTGEPPARSTQNTQTNNSNRNIQLKPAEVGMNTSTGPGDREIMYDDKATRRNTDFGAISSSVARETPAQPLHRKSMPAYLNTGAPEDERRSEPARKPPSDKSSPAADPMEKIFEDLLEFLRVWCAKVPIQFSNPEDQDQEPQIRLGLQTAIVKEILKIRSTDRRCVEDKHLFEDMLENEVDGLLDCLEQNPELVKQRGPLKNELIQYVSRMNEIIMGMDARQTQKSQLNTTVDYVELFDKLRKTNYAGKFVDEHYPSDNRTTRIILTDYYERVMKAFLGYNKLENVHGNEDEIMKNMIEVMLNAPQPSEEYFKNKQQNLLLRNEIEEWFQNLPVDELPESEKACGYIVQRLDTLANMMLGIENGFVNANESRTLEYELHIWLLTWSWPCWAGYHTNQWVSELLTRIRLNPDLKMDNCLPDWDLDPEQSLKSDVFVKGHPLSSTMKPKPDRHRSKKRAPFSESCSRGSSPHISIQSESSGGSIGVPSTKKSGVPSRVQTSRGILGTSQLAGPSFRPSSANPQEVAVTNEVNNWVARLPVQDIQEERSKQLCRRIIGILNSNDDDTEVMDEMNDQISSWLNESLPESQKAKIPNYANKLTVAVLNKRQRPDSSDRQRSRTNKRRKSSQDQNQQPRSENQRQRFNQDQNQLQRFDQDQYQRPRCNQCQNRRLRFDQDQNQRPRLSQGQNQRSRFDLNKNQRPRFDQDQNQRPRFDQDKNQRPRFNRDTGHDSLESSYSEPFLKKSERGTHPMFEMSSDNSELDLSCKCPNDESQSGLRVCMRGPCPSLWYPMPDPTPMHRPSYY